MAELKAYRHTGPGHWIGSEYTVVTSSEEKARELIRAALDSAGLAGEDINELEVIPLKDGTFLTEINGDY